MTSEIIIIGDNRHNLGDRPLKVSAEFTNRIDFGRNIWASDYAEGEVTIATQHS